MADFQVNIRLETFIREGLQITPFAFSKSIGDMQGVRISQVLRHRNGVSTKLMDTICAGYPKLNRSWLLTGEGNMLAMGETMPIVQGSDDVLTVLGNEQFGIDFMIRVSGSNFLPKYKADDIIACKIVGTMAIEK